MTTTPTVALWGAGMISMAHAAACRQLGWPVVAVASRSIERTNSRARELGAAPATFDELRHHPTADTVIVSTPPHCHADDAMRLLDAGYAVVLEKPLCRTLAEADALVAASERPGRRLLYAENLAYAPIVVTLLRQIPDLGRLTHLEARSLQALPTWGDFTSDEWGGGALFDLGVHPIAVVLLAASAGGAGAPVSVRCELRGASDGSHDSDEHAELVVTFESGLRARVVSSWQGAATPDWDLQAASPSGVVRAEIFPQLLLERDGEPIALPPATAEPAIIEHLGYVGQLRALQTSMSNGRGPEIDARFGRDVLDVVCAAYASAGRGAEVPLPFTGPRDRTPLELWRRPS